MLKIVCGNCGNVMDVDRHDDTVFCVKCGKLLQVDECEILGNERGPAEGVPVKSEAPDTSATRPGLKRKNSKVIAAVVCAAVVLVAVLLAILIISVGGGGNIVGDWQNDTLHYVFFEDGSCVQRTEIMGICNDINGTYTTSGSTLTMELDMIVMKQEMVFEYKISDDVLLLTAPGAKTGLEFKLVTRDPDSAGGASSDDISSTSGGSGSGIPDSSSGGSGSIAGSSSGEESSGGESGESSEKSISEYWPSYNYSDISNAHAGDVVIFGRYEQDNNMGNGQEDIEWIVLDRQNDSMLIVSRYALDCQRYHPEYTEVTWETCGVRNWLNTSFMNNAFTSEEQERIITTCISPVANPKHNTDPGNMTYDRVFLLSIDEAATYFASDKDRECVPTPYAVANGALVSDTDFVGGEGTGWWHLRSPGVNQRDDAIVKRNGQINYAGGSVINKNGCIRPALWILN